MTIADTPVSSCMDTDVPTISEDATLREAVESVHRLRNACVIVTDASGNPVGLITEGDVIRRFLAVEVPSGVHLREILTSMESAVAHVQARRRAHGDRVKDLMSHPLIALDAGDSLVAAAGLFQKHRIGQFPVTKNGKLVGLLRRHELVDEILRQQDSWAAGLSGAQERRGDAGDASGSSS